MLDIDLEENERIKDQWVLTFIAGDGRRFNGDFAVTNKNVYYIANFEIKTVGVNQTDYGLKVPPASVSEVRSFKKLGIFNRFTLVLTDGQEFTFDRGIMSIKGIVKQIEHLLKSKE